MTAQEIVPLAAWLNTVRPNEWKKLQGLHYSSEPFHVPFAVGSSPGFMIWPLSSLPLEQKERPIYQNEISRKRFVDSGYDLAGWRVRFDIVAAHFEIRTDGTEAPYIMFAAARTGSGCFCETMARVMEYVDSYSMGKWCFYNKAFHFQEEGDALMTNAYVYS